MKIIEIKIANFGKFSNFSQKFSEKLNIFAKPNGYGKTTLAHFLSAMLYGLPDMRVKGTENARIRYMPWQRGIFGGSLIFEYQNKKYQVKREFGYGTKSDDTFNFYDYPNNNEIKEINDTKVTSETLGEILLGINKISFEKTNFIPQASVSYFHDNNDTLYQDINQRLRLILGDDYADDDYQKGVNHLKNISNKLKPNSRRNTLYSQLESDISYTNQKLSSSEEAVKNVSHQQEKLRLLKKEETALSLEIKETKKNIQIINTYQERKLRKETYQKNVDLLAKTEKNLTDKKQFFLKTTPEKTDLILLKTVLDNLIIKEREKEDVTNKNNLAIQKINYQKATLESNHKYAESLVLEKNSLEKNLNAENNKMGSLKLKIKGFAFLDIILAIITLSIYYFIVKFKNNKIESEIRTIKTNIENIYEQINLKDEQISAFKAGDIADLEKEIIELEKALKKEEKDYNEEKKKVEVLYSSYDVNLDNLNVSYYKIENNYKDYFNYQTEVKRLKEELEKTDLSDLKNETIEAPSFDLTTLMSKESELNANKEHLIKEINSLERDLLSNQMIADEEEFYQEELRLLREQRNVYDEKREIAELALNFLTNANQEIAAKYLEPLGKNVNELIKRFNLEDIFIRFDGNSKIQFKKKGSFDFYDIGHCSDGDKELIFVLVRLALVNIIYKDISPFLILDDSFANFDDDKIKIVKPLLEELANQYQVIYFTCSESRNLK